jgi:hypothetical protein
MTKSTSNLVGLFLVLDSSDHESCRTGQIVAAVGNGYLIQFDKVEAAGDGPPLPTELHTLEELSRICAHCGQKLAHLFKRRADMERWLAWLSEPEKPAGETGKVVRLKKPH